MENIQKLVSPVSIALVIASILASFVGYKYVDMLYKENVSSSYNKDGNTLSIKGKSEKTVTLDTVWAEFEVISVNLEGKNNTLENRTAYDKKLVELTDKIKSFGAGIDSKNITIEIVDATDYTVDETVTKPIIKPVAVAPKLKVKEATEENISSFDGYESSYDSDYEYGDSYDKYNYEDTDYTKDKKVFSVILSYPVGKVTIDQLETLAKDLDAKKVSVYNSLSRKAYDDLDNELNNKAVKNAFEKANSRASAFGKNAVPQDNYSYASDMLFSMTDANTAKYSIENTYSFRLE